MSDNEILVVGAAGHFAGLVVPALAALGVHPRGFVRKPEEAEIARRNGAGETMIGDLRDAASLDAALRGVSRAFYLSPVFQPDEAAMGKGFVAAAQRARVRRIVFSSLISPSLDLENHAAKRPVENALYESGLEYTVLRPTVFYQNMAGAWPAIEKGGVLAEPFSASSKISRVDYRDVADVAAVALTEDRLLWGAFELCADEGMDRGAVAAIAGEALGRPIKPAALRFADWYEKAGLKLDDRQKQQMEAMYAHYDRSGLRGNPLVLRTVLGREPRSLRAFFDDLAAGRPTTAA